MQRLPHLLLAILLLALATAFAAGCGDEEDPPASDSPSSQSPPDNEAPPAQDPAQEELEAAGIDPTTGVYRGLKLDARRGDTTLDVEAVPLPAAAQAAGCTLRLGLPDELRGVPPARRHLQPGEPPPRYGTTPATSGRHADPAADGAYREAPPEVNVVHSLEHGRVAIQYSPDLPADQQLMLKGLFDQDPDGTLLFPNPDMPYDVAVTAWTDLIGCAKFGSSTIAAVAAFRDGFRGKGPERIPL